MILKELLFALQAPFDTWVTVQELKGPEEWEPIASGFADDILFKSHGVLTRYRVNGFRAIDQDNIVIEVLKNE